MTREEFEKRYHKSPEEVLEEMRKLRSEHPGREICCPAEDWAFGLVISRQAASARQRKTQTDGLRNQKEGG